jgi:dTDP-4-dehydrorhamnose reductase
VTPVPTDEYAHGKALAPRPRNSVLDLAKIKATGFTPRDMAPVLDDYIRAANDG